jgi:hypothetical protein
MLQGENIYFIKSFSYLRKRINKNLLKIGTLLQPDFFESILMFNIKGCDDEKNISCGRQQIDFRNDFP